SAEVFDPTNGTWTDWAFSMTHPRAVHRMVDLLDGSWFLVGGSNTDLRAGLFDTATGQFTPVAPAADDHGRFGPAVARFDSANVSVVGGESFAQVLWFNATSATLVQTGSTTTRPRAYATATRIAPTMILVAGGIDFPNNNATLSTCDAVVEG